MLVDFLGLLMAGSSQIVSSQVNRHFSTLALMHEKMRAGSRLHSDVQKAGRGRTLYVTHVYYTVFPSLLEYLYPQGLMGVHTGASRNCGSQSFPSCTHSTRLREWGALPLSGKWPSTTSIDCAGDTTTGAQGLQDSQSQHTSGTLRRTWRDLQPA